MKFSATQTAPDAAGMYVLDAAEIDAVGGGVLPLLAGLFAIGFVIGYLAGPEGLGPVGDAPLPALGTS